MRPTQPFATYQSHRMPRDRDHIPRRPLSPAGRPLALAHTSASFEQPARDSRVVCSHIRSSSSVLCEAPCVRSGAHDKDISLNFGQAAHDPVSLCIAEHYDAFTEPDAPSANWPR